MSRGIESLRKVPPPARISIRVSARNWPSSHSPCGASPWDCCSKHSCDGAALAPFSPCSLVSGGRASVPITRIVCALGSSRGLPCSASFASPESLKDCIWAETAKARKLSTIQPAAAIPTHLRIRLPRVPAAGGGGRLPSPCRPSGRFERSRAGRAGPAHRACGTARRSPSETGRPCSRAARRAAAHRCRPWSGVFEKPDVRLKAAGHLGASPSVDSPAIRLHRVHDLLGRVS